MKIKITSEEREVLLSTPKFSQGLVDLIRSSKFSGKNWELEIAEEDADAIRDFCGEKLQEIGFDEKYELTEAGKAFEALIDKFFVA